MKKITIVTILIAFFASVSFASEVNIFSARHYDSDIQLYEKFTAKTGIKVNIVSGKDKALQKRITEEGKDCIGDLYITADAGRLGAFQAKGMFQRGASSKAVKAVVPANFRTSYWTGIAKRARIIYYSPERVSVSDLKGMTYEDLADPKWKGKICTRPGSHAYNRSLLASIIAANGETGAEEWAKNLVANLARKPEGNDRAQAKAIYEGVCDIAVMNTYYYGKMKFNEKNPEQKKWANAINLVFTNQNDRGNHINVAGGGVVKYSKNKDNAIALLEFLTTPMSQALYSSMNYEYPVNPTMSLSNELQSWGEFKEDELPIEKLAELAPVAQKIIDRVGW